MTEALVVPARLDAGAPEIAERHPDLAASSGLVLQEVVRTRVVLMEEDCGVHEDVDRALGTLEQRRPQIDGNLGPVRVERDELCLARGVGSFLTRDLRP